MTSLSHIVEPELLLVTWQPVADDHVDRTRRVIAEVRRDGSTREMTFKYLNGTDDWLRAVAAGFQGYPAFDIDPETRFYGPGVRESLLRRLPPTSREDFPEFLSRHSLPSPFPGSELALLGYTGARLPGDGFALVPVFSPENLPCEYVLEVAGTRHVFTGDLSSVRPGDEVVFEPEPQNVIDGEAIAIHHRLGKLGYVNRVLLNTFHKWMEHGLVTGNIDRLNGKPERPLVFVRLHARPAEPTVATPEPVTKQVPDLDDGLDLLS